MRDVVEVFKRASVDGSFRHFIGMQIQTVQHSFGLRDSDRYTPQPRNRGWADSKRMCAEQHWSERTNAVPKMFGESAYVWAKHEVNRG